MALANQEFPPLLGLLSGGSGAAPDQGFVLSAGSAGPAPRFPFFEIPPPHPQPL